MQTMRRTIMFAVVIAATAVFGVLTAAGAEAKTVEVDDWAADFCDEMGSWQTTAEKAHDLVQDVVDNGVSSSSKAKATRTRIVAALDAASKKSASVSKAVKALGTPDTTNGAKISSMLAAGIADAGHAFADAKDDAADAPTDPKQFRSTMSRISDHVDRDLREVGDDLESISALDKKGDIDAAFSTEPSCKALDENSS